MSKWLYFIIRLVVFCVVVVAVLGLLVGGGLFVWEKTTSGSGEWSLPKPQDGGGIEQALIGLYLQLRQGDVEARAGSGDANVAFQVHDGESAAEIASRLESAGLITDASLFRMLVRYYGIAENLEAGDYELHFGMTMMEIAEALQHGRLQEIVITIPEGWRSEQIASLLASQGVLQEEELLELVAGVAFPYDFLLDRPDGAPQTLEGYLFPDTYRISPQATPRDVVSLLLNNFGQKFDPELRARAKELGMTINEVVVIASIVEREAVLPEERALIAGVYHNRLEEGMYLGACPTVQYAKGYDSVAQSWWGALTAADYQEVDSPYNTYTHRGLPPAPICNPGLESLRAALYPADTEFLYFVLNDVKGDGSHVFSRTYDEHLANQREYGR